MQSTQLANLDNKIHHNVLIFRLGAHFWLKPGQCNISTNQREQEINKISGYKSIQGKRGWYETHINEGESNRGRIYVRFDPSTMKFDVDIGYKKNDKSQSRQIASLPVSV